jgi:hypothetical protein
MPKKDFKASIGAGIKSQDAANIDRFGKADSVLSTLDAATDRQRQAEQPAPSKTLVVRHTFSMSEGDYALLEARRKAAAAIPGGPIYSASEICRAAIHAFSGHNGDEVISAVDKLERLKPGKRS